jgi:hypothetical protein
MRSKLCTVTICAFCVFVDVTFLISLLPLPHPMRRYWFCGSVIAAVLIGECVLFLLRFETRCIPGVVLVDFNCELKHWIGTHLLCSVQRSHTVLIPNSVFQLAIKINQNNTRNTTRFKSKQKQYTFTNQHSSNNRAAKSIPPHWVGQWEEWNEKRNIHKHTKSTNGHCTKLGPHSCDILSAADARNSSYMLYHTHCVLAAVRWYTLSFFLLPKEINPHRKVADYTLPISPHRNKTHRHSFA